MQNAIAQTKDTLPSSSLPPISGCGLRRSQRHAEVGVGHTLLIQIALPLLLALSSSSLLCGAQQNSVSVQVDWPAFLARQDLVWDRPPQAWEEAPFMGNGLLGTMFWHEPDTNYFRLQMGRTDVQEHRTDPPDEHPSFARSRLPIGDFLIKPVGRILSTSGFRLDLWNAETTGTIITDRGCIKISTYVHSVEMGIVLEAKGDEGERDLTITWRPAEATSPRQAYGLRRNELSRVSKTYEPNPAPSVERVGQISVCAQPLNQGGETVTAWRIITTGTRHRLLATVAHSFPDDSARAAAIETIKQLSSIDTDTLREVHRKWWHDFYPQSFVSFTDPQLESFYWIQMYKLASATRGDRALIDNQGPWLQETPWPGAWWNLNVQLSYWPTYTSNRLELGRSLLNTLMQHRQTLVENIPVPYRSDSSGIGRATGLDLSGKVGIPGVIRQTAGRLIQEDTPEVGLLPWICHNLWLHYRHSMDDAMLRDQLYPLLRRAINYYLHFLVKGDDGKLHLPETYSPEYGNAPDCNFDLSLLRWGCETLLASSDRLKLDDPLRSRWREVLSTLTPYPQDENGYMIGRGVPYAYSHRHYSHLLMIYPLYLVNIEQPKGAAIIEKSVAAWQSRPEKLMGYSYTGGASMAAAIGHGDEALAQLRRLWSDFLRPNTFYREAGPVIETPLSAAQSIHDMLLQSWGGKIRVFPAVPSAWNEVAIHNLRAEGAFLVSARRSNGATEFIQVRSLAGEPCVIKTDLVNPVAQSGGRDIEIFSVGPNTYHIPLEAQQEAILYPAGTLPELRIRPVDVRENEINLYGINARSQSLNRERINIDPVPSEN